MRLNGGAGARWARGNVPDAEAREKDDFYPTPPSGTRALLAVETFEGTIWEPACGDGAIAKVLEAAGHRVLATDLVDRGYGVPRVDFLLHCPERADNIVTNPPFKLANDFARLALERASRKVALLCRLAWLEGQERRALFEASPLARVWVFSKRLAIWRNGVAEERGGGLIAFAWFVFEHGYRGMPNLGWVEPDEKPFAEDMRQLYADAYRLRIAVP
jgi:hypothetical protein